MLNLESDENINIMVFLFKMYFCCFIIPVKSTLITKRIECVLEEELKITCNGKINGWFEHESDDLSIVCPY